MSQDVPVVEQIRDLDKQLSDLQLRLAFGREKQEIAQLDSDVQFTRPGGVSTISWLSFQELFGAEG